MMTIRHKVPPPNLNFDNIFYTWFGAKPPNLKTANISGYMVILFCVHLVPHWTHTICMNPNLTPDPAINTISEQLAKWGKEGGDFKERVTMPLLSTDVFVYYS